MLTLFLASAAAAANWTDESPAQTTARLDAARLPYEMCLSDAVAGRPGSEPAESSTRVAAAVCREREERLRAEYLNSPLNFMARPGDIERLMQTARQRGEDAGLTRRQTETETAARVRGGR